jgi:selenocysteine lyase/cysteine desulfurase
MYADHGANCRFSFHLYTTEADVDAAVSAWRG